MEKFKKRHKQLTSLVLSAAMIFSLVPGTVGAKAETRVEKQVNQTAERDTNKKSVSKTALKTISADFKAQKFAELYEEGGLSCTTEGITFDTETAADNLLLTGKNKVVSGAAITLKNTLDFGTDKVQRIQIDALAKKATKTYMEVYLDDAVTPTVRVRIPNQPKTDNWTRTKGSATDFTEQQYYATIANTLGIEDVIEGHLKIMNELDPEHNIDLIVDEWGTWYEVEPGTNPAFLYQQNTMRDAIVAALNLNIFNKHSDRISMANIAQVVNVLQALVLTEGDQIVKTPTYDVFAMYKEHQGASLVQSAVDTLPVDYDGKVIPSLSESVSVSDDGNMTITLANTSLKEEIQVICRLEDKSQFNGQAEIAVLQDEVHAHNTFEQPDQVKVQYRTEHWNGSEQTVTLLPCSVCRIHCPIV